MNNSTQAQKGFKTFLATLFISFLVFSAVYYFATEASLDLSVDDSLELTAAAPQAQDDVLGTQDTQEQETDEAQSVFGEIANRDPQVEAKAVLAGEDTSETTTPAVPNTGTSGITVGIIFSLGVFGSGIYYLITDPRKKALKAFEEKSIR